MERTIKLSKIFNSPECKEYEASLRECIKFIKRGEVESSIVKKRYNKALESYRKFLNKNQIILPIALYPYDAENKKTHRFKDIILKEITDEKGNKSTVYVKTVPNCEWIYSGQFEKTRKIRIVL